MSKKRKRGVVQAKALKDARRAVTISLVMIVKDEAERLPHCLDSVRDHVTELIVVDTGSTDGTAAIAAAHGARVESFPWCDDFAVARNFALSLATGAWALHLDADETLDPATAAGLRRLAAGARPDVWAFALPVVSAVEADGRPGETVSYQKRLFRRRPEVIAYRRPIHEEVMHRGLAAGNGVSRTEKLRVLHEGYRDAAAAKEKFRTRNLPILLRAQREDPEEHYYALQLAMFAAGAGDPDLAADYFAGGFERMTDGERRASELLPAATCELMHALLATGRYQEAWNAGRPVAEYTQPPELSLFLGRAALGIGDLDTAVAYLQAARKARDYHGVRLLPGATTWLPLWDLSSCYLLAGATTAALEAASAALPDAPEQSGLALRIALCAVRLGDLTAAEDCLRGFHLLATEAPASGDQTADLLAAIAGGMATRGDHHGLLAVYTDLITRGDAPEWRRGRARAAAALGRRAQAADDMEALLLLAPGDAEATVMRAETLRDLGDARGAAAMYAAATRLDPSDAGTWFELATLQHDQGAILDAGEAARRVIALDPDNGAAHRLLAECLRERGDVLGACDLLIDRLAAQADDKESRFLLAALLETAGAREEALAVMSQGIDHHHDDAELYLRLGRMLADRGRTDDAFNAFDIAARLAPEGNALTQALGAVRQIVSRPTPVAAAAFPAGLRFGRS